ncbi:MAG: NUDIX hydrolase [Chloroflexota bacterium]|nr:NUDIX hydrolase [Chloroflexota bacterium]
MAKAGTVATANEQGGDKGAALRLTAVLAVDVVVFTVREAEELEDRWQVLLVRSQKPVFGGKRALPGVLVRDDETCEVAARRALRDKCGVDAAEWYLEQLATYSAPGRDDRGRVASVAHVALVRSDEVVPVPGGSVTDAEWVPVRRALREALAFDHSDMLREAAQRVRSKLRYSWVAFQLMPDHFSIADLRSVYAAILDPSVARLNTTNFRYAFRDLFESGVIEPTGDRAEATGKGRPGELYRFRGTLRGTRPRELRWQAL